MEVERRQVGDMGGILFLDLVGVIVTPYAVHSFGLFFCPFYSTMKIFFFKCYQYLLSSSFCPYPEAMVGVVTFPNTTL